MSVLRAITAGRLLATNIAIERARLAGTLRAIRDLGGMDAVRSITATEIERLTLPKGEQGNWVG